MNTYLEQVANTSDQSADSLDIFGASLSRRGFVTASGALLAFFGLSSASGKQAPAANAAGSGLSAESFIEIHADNTILMRTGKSDFGQGTIFTAYRQIVAE